MIRLGKNQRGYSLVELMIATALTSFLLVLIVGFMTNALVTNNTDIARADVLRDAQLALDVITRDVRLSSNADTANRWQDTYAPNAPANKLSWSSGANTLVLATSAENGSNTILFEDALHYIPYKNNNIYFVSNGVLYKRTLAAPVTGTSALTTCPAANATASCPADRILAKNVTTFSLRYLNDENIVVNANDAESIEITLGTQINKYGKVLSASYTTRSVFRNE
jgi:prepilin-type N-terminal cleavage/methylation domain-containing protein